MARARQQMRRFWCGAFPLFDISSLDAEFAAFFGADTGAASLRTQLRLKLTETPSITQSRRGTLAQYTELIDLTDRYRRQVIALLRYANTPSAATDLPYTPLFFGFGEIDLRTDRVVGKEQRLSIALRVDVVLVFMLLGQLHGLHAEALVEQGMKLQSEAIVTAAEVSWRNSTQQFTRAASIARASMTECVSADPQLATVIKFFTLVTTQAIVMARIAQLLRASTRIISITLVDETVERLARNAVVCARYACTVTNQLLDIAPVLDDSTLSRQLAWLIQSYAMRWRVIYLSQEQAVFQSDFQPEITYYYCELVQRTDRLPAPPDCSHRQDVYFNRLATELQQDHIAHLTEAVNSKTELLDACQRKRGPTWTAEPLPRELIDAMTAIAALDELFTDEDHELDLVLSEDEGSLSVDAITTSIERAKEKAMLETASLSQYSNVAILATDAGGNSETHRAIQPPTPSVKKEPTTSDWVSIQVGDKTLHFEPLPSPTPASRPYIRPATASAVIERRRNAVPMVIDDTQDRLEELAATRQSKLLRPSSSSSYLTHKHKKMAGALTWVPTRVSCALCERRFTRSNLPGVVVMKRVFDLRRKWGMVLTDSKKFNAASALYGQASVCLMCQDILTFEDEATMHHVATRPLDDIGQLILHRIQLNWTQRPAPSDEMLLDVAVNKRARQSSTNFGLSATNAVLADSLRAAHTKEELQPWWEVDLGNYYVVHSVKVWLREDASHVFSYGGVACDRNMDHQHHAVVPAGRGLASGALTPAPQPNLGLYPLHITVSMKTGVDRDLDDVLASAVSSHCVATKATQPLTWLTPPNCRGRFVRVQAEGVAFLHVERVNVFVAHELPTHSATRKRETARHQLKRAAFRASVMSAKTPQTAQFDERHATLAALTFQARVSAPSSSNNNQETVPPPRKAPALASMFGGDPQQAEARRISRLYLKFKGLLDARAKYAVASEDSPTQTHRRKNLTIAE